MHDEPTRLDLEAFRGFTVEGRDGVVGKITDVLFHLAPWTLAYIVVDTGSWLTGRRILLSPQSFREIDLASKKIRCDLDRERIDASPVIEERAPVTRTIALEVDRYYHWHDIWITGGPIFAHPPLAEPIREGPGDLVVEVHESVEDDFQLYSARDLESFSVKAVGGEKCGTVKSFVIDMQRWRVAHVVVSTGWLLHERLVVAPVHLVHRVDPYAREVELSASRHEITEAPSFQEISTLNPRQDRAIRTYFAGAVV